MFTLLLMIRIIKSELTCAYVVDYELDLNEKSMVDPCEI